MKYFLIFTIFATLAWAIDGAAIDTDDVKFEGDDSPVLPPVDDINEDCNQPKVTGRCFALFHRYAYNVENRACEEFIYGGCGGNTNNFETKEECERKCTAPKTNDDVSPTEVTTATTTEKIASNVETEEKTQ